MSPTSSASSRPRDDLRERVRETIDIADVVGSYISLRRAGRGLVGLCPWHDDARPSLQVNPERQTYRCWVCNIGGDVFNFVMRMEKLEFREALEQLADRCGIALPRGRGGISADDKANLRDTLAWAAARYRDCLRQAAEAAPARSYLAGRGLSAATLDHFDVGFVPAAWDWLLRQAALAGISAATLAAAGLVVARNDGNGHYDRFRGRVIFPIRDAQGRCIAFGGRVLPGSDDPAKYVNSPETPLFSKRRVLGTALGAEHAKVLRRYADRVVLVLDGDEAGRRRADEILDLLLAEPIDVRIARLPSGADPCDYLTAEGRDAFEQVLEAAIDPLDYRMDAALARLRPDAGDDAALEAIDSVLRALAAAGRGPDVTPRVRLREDQVLGRLGRRFGLARDTLRARLLELRRAADGPDRAAQATDPESLPALPAWDREVIEVLVGVPGSTGLIVRQIGGAGVDSRACRQVLEVAERLHAEGREVGLGSLLLEITDPSLQSLLVAVDEASAARPTDPQDRLRHLEDALHRRAAERRATASARALSTTDGLDTRTEAELLERLVAERRVAQGMSDPKDG
ncbi:MAG: toprim domain-containing protein [Planctomycetia bacterium]|nr:toprim domain-containing protein [Planctomycetia bacterium]